MKIPTLLGLALLITALALGMMLYFYQKNLEQEQKPLFEPKKIQIVNISDTQATIVWWSDKPAIAQVIFGSNDLKKIGTDNRDRDEPKEHAVHFVTLKDLKPDTLYKYQIKSSKFLYPDQPMNFKTAKTLEQNQKATLQKPIKGTVLNTNLNPIDEALVFLKIDEAQDIASFTSTSGNFVIPLADLRSKSLENYYEISNPISATLLITKGDLTSEVQITLPGELQTLPPITIGQNINLKEYLASTSARLKKQTDLENPEIVNKFDLNGDKKVNSLDLAEVFDLYNSNQKDKKADFNSDGKIDQQDIDIISKALDI